MAHVNDSQAQGRSLLEQMVTAQPDRLPRKMRAAGYDLTEAEDLGQETLTRAVRSLADLRGPVDEALVCGWVDSIATNLIRNQRRTMARRPRVQTLAPGDAEQPSTALEDPTEDLVCRATLQALLASLPEEQRHVFAARVLDQQPTAQVAQQLGIPADTVRWRLRRARERLRTQLDLMS